MAEEAALEGDSAFDGAAVAQTLSARLPSNGCLAVGDGAGYPVQAWPGVLELLRRRPDVRLLLGWCLGAPDGWQELNQARVSTLVSGFGMRRPIDAGCVRFLPVRLGTVPALLHGRLRPDVLLTALRPDGAGYAFTTEVSWQRAAVDAGAAVVAVVREAALVADTGAPLAADRVTILGASPAVPGCLQQPAPTPVHHEIAERAAALIPEGVRLQVGPGGLGAAVYAAVRRPVAVDTGLVTDAVVDLDRRGMLIGRAIAPYVTGTEVVYDWYAGKVQLAGVEFTHDPGRLCTGAPLVAVNTGLEIDVSGQVNAEAAGGSALGGVGGQPDYAAAAASSPSGLSVIAIPTRNAFGAATLVDRLQAPVTTPGHDVDVVVTERGSADLRGLSRAERRTALVSLWEHEPTAVGDRFVSG